MGVAGERGAAGATRHALLGLLLQRPAHGYDLARRFEAPAALAEIVHLTPSHLYALLGRLERDDAIAGEHQDAGTRPQRRVYRLTPAGRAAVQAWLAEPVGHPRDMRIEFPLKLYIAHAIDPAQARRLADRQREVFLAYIARLRVEPAAGGNDFERAYVDLMRQGRIGRAQAALAWLEACNPVLRGT